MRDQHKSIVYRELNGGETGHRTGNEHYQRYWGAGSLQGHPALAGHQSQAVSLHSTLGRLCGTNQQ